MAVSNHQTFGAWLKRYVIDQDYTYTAFAEAVGASQSMVSNWINDKKIPSPRYCDRIAEVLSLDLDEVLIRAGHRPELAVDLDPTVRELIALVRDLPPDDRPAAQAYLQFLVGRGKRRRKRDVSLPGLP